MCALLVFLLLRFIICESALHPVVLVPGDGGSQLEAKLDKESVVHYVCQKKTDDYFVLWLNVKLLVPVAMHCWADNMRLVYNSTTRKTENSPGVFTRVPGFGYTATVENVEASQASVGNYFKSIVEESLIPIGYQRNVSIRGAPFDFRKAPNELHVWFHKLKRLIEDTYVRNGNQSIIIISHSMGSPLTQYFLHGRTSQWKEKYIRALISLAGAWGGSVKALKVFLSGDNLGSFMLSTTLLREEQKTFPSIAWLLPSKVFWSRNENLVVINGKRNYTVADYEQLFMDINHPDGNEMRKDTENLLHVLRPPGVETFCVHGNGISTVESIYYKASSSFPEKPSFVYGNGDGTVNIRSLRGCLRWQPVSGRSLLQLSPNSQMVFRDKLKHGSIFGKNKHNIHSREFPGVDHMGVLSDPSVLNYVQTTVLGINDDRNDG